MANEAITGGDGACVRGRRSAMATGCGATNQRRLMHVGGTDGWAIGSQRRLFSTETSAMKLSVITPTQNRLAFLKENVASVQCSVLAPLDLEVEHVVHDLGSDDGTHEWLREQAGQDGRLRVVRSAEAMPPGRARNRAIAQATGELVMALDDDDLLLQRTAFHFAEGLGAGKARWAVADFLRVDAERRYHVGDDYYTWRFESAEQMLAAIFSGSHFIQGNVCFRRSLLDEVGGYADDLTTAEDLELYTRFLLADGLPRYLPMVSHLHRMHGDNLSKDISKDRYNEDMTRIYERHAGRLRERGIELKPIA
ncbi:MAG: glycosyltransferase [Myxococcales bacterium]|nr:MAG: glycosyltransferase [Myxococcales bacterium]